MLSDVVGPHTVRSLYLVLAVLVLGAGGQPELSELRQIKLEVVSPSWVRVSLLGTRPPDLSVLDSEEPFEIVVDWTGSQTGNHVVVPTFRPGLLASIELEQMVVEAEPTTRVRLRLSQQRPYRVRVHGGRVDVEFKALRGMLAWREKSKEQAEGAIQGRGSKISSPKSFESTSGGPLIERDVPIPSAPPKIRGVNVATAQGPDPSKLSESGANTQRRVKRSLEPRRSTIDSRIPARALGAELPSPLVMAAVRIDAPGGFPSKLPMSKKKWVRTIKVPVRVGPMPSNLLKARQALAQPLKKMVSVMPSVLKTPTKDVPIRKFRLPAKVESTVEKVRGPTVKKPRSRLAQFPGKKAEEPKRRRLANFSGKSPRPIPVESSPTESSPTESSPPENVPNKLLEQPKRQRRKVVVSREHKGPRVLSDIGFQQLAGTSRVFVRLSRKAQFRHKPSPAPDTFVLELVNTGVGQKAHLLPLDTSFFPGPVSFVQARRIGENIHVEVRLRSATHWKIKSMGTTVAVDFVSAN